MTKLTIEQAEKLTTKRLLKYYKKYSRSWSAKYFCDCCGTPMWDLYPSDGSKERFDEENSYWNSIKGILNTREHVS